MAHIYAWVMPHINETCHTYELPTVSNITNPLSACLQSSDWRRWASLLECCNVLQRVATYCSVLQWVHTASHSNTLQNVLAASTCSSLFNHIPIICIHARCMHAIHVYLYCMQYIYRTDMYTCTARSREDVTRNGHRNTKRNPRLWKLRSLFKWAVWKETCDDHRGLRCVFRWLFRVSSSRERPVLHAIKCVHAIYVCMHACHTACMHTACMHTACMQNTYTRNTWLYWTPTR